MIKQKSVVTSSTIINELHIIQIDSKGHKRKKNRLEKRERVEISASNPNVEELILDREDKVNGLNTRVENGDIRVVRVQNTRCALNGRLKEAISELNNRRGR